MTSDMRRDSGEGRGVEKKNVPSMRGN